MGDHLDWTEYRRKMNVVRAFIWREDGDHPYENCGEKKYDPVLKEHFKGHGSIIRPFVPDTIDAFEDICPECEIQLQWHGQMSVGGRMVKVCPGDYIIEDSPGAQFPLKEEEFFELFEVIEGDEEKKVHCNDYDWRTAKEE